MRTLRRGNTRSGRLSCDSPVEPNKERARSEIQSLVKSWPRLGSYGSERLNGETVNRAYRKPLHITRCSISRVVRCMARSVQCLS